MEARRHHMHDYALVPKMLTARARGKTPRSVRASAIVAIGLVAG